MLPAEPLKMDKGSRLNINWNNIGRAVDFYVDKVDGEEIEWAYGTGLAEPRTSLVLQKNEGLSSWATKKDC